MNCTKPIKRSKYVAVSLSEHEPKSPLPTCTCFDLDTEHDAKSNRISTEVIFPKMQLLRIGWHQWNVERRSTRWVRVKWASFHMKKIIEWAILNHELSPTRVMSKRWSDHGPDSSVFCGPNLHTLSTLSKTFDVSPKTQDKASIRSVCSNEVPPVFTGTCSLQYSSFLIHCLKV